MASASYGIRLQMTSVDTGATLTLQRATDSGFSVALTTVYTKTGAIAGTVYEYVDALGVQTTVYYYRARETRTGYANGAYATGAGSGYVSSAPYDLGI